ncbi:MAG: lytic transglycosylase domain-containing protein [Cytophagales bacterium]|nr:lytic transglycosylase domain-containing protein [Rhizobacter sp.]
MKVDMPSPSAARLFRFSAARAVWACCAAAAAHATAAQHAEGIYLTEGDDGAIHLSDHAEDARARLLVETRAAQPAAPNGQTAMGSPRDRQLTEIVRTAASRHRVAPELLHAVIATESGYAVRAVSPRGAQGLMQLMPATALGYGVTDPFDPRQNVNAGAQHLRRLLDQFGQNTTLALAAYNAGAAAVVRHRYSIPPFAETAAYVPRVLRHLAQLRSESTPSLLP